MNDPRYLSTAIEAALAAGRTQLRYFRQNPEIRKKGPIDLVTEADLEVEREFRDLVASRFPDHEVLGEEGSGGWTPASGPPRWIVDPIDGTTNFAHGLALFCISIALEIDGRIALGVVYDPVGRELFTAERGAGARLNGLPLRVSNRERLIDGLLCTGFPYTVQTDRRRQVDLFAAFLGRARAVRRLGSAALDLCYVAAGRFDGFWEDRLHPWDIAAAALIAEEAGAAVTDYAGQPVDLGHGQIVAVSPALRDEVLGVIAASWPDTV